MLTQQQAKLLRFIADYCDRRGGSPSYEEMREHLGLASKNGITRLINALIERGFIRRNDGRSRNIEIIRLPSALRSLHSHSTEDIIAELTSRGHDVTTPPTAVEALLAKLAPIFEPHQLVATYEDDGDESVDPAVVVRLAGSKEDDDLGDIQCADNVYVANIWADLAKTARFHGMPRTKIEDAANDLIGLLERHNQIAAR